MSKQYQNFSTYFLYGTNKNKYSLKQQIQISKHIENDNLIQSFLIYNPNEMLKKVSLWKKHLPWIKPYFAVKSSPNQYLIKDFYHHEVGVDCASKNQIELAIGLGVTPQDIVYSNSIKNEKDLVYAQQVGVKITTADNFYQIKKIRKFAQKMRILWRISIKQNQGDILTSQFSKKYGDQLQNDQQIHQRMKEISDLGVNLLGVHFHCGSGFNGSTGFQKGVKMARRYIQIGRQYGHEMKILDIGGGFPSGNITQSTIKVLQITNNDPLDYITIAQPGRHLSSQCFSIATRIIGKTTRKQKLCFYINQSVFHTFNCVLVDGISFDGKQQFYNRIKNRQTFQIDQNISSTTLFGMTCDGMDIICKDFRAPERLQIGDWLVFGGMGAYTYSIKSQFNGMLAAQSTLKLEQII